MRAWACISLIIVLAWGNALLAKPQPATLKPTWAMVESRLKKKGFRKAFIQDLKSTYSAADFLQVAELNVLLFLRKDNYHATQVSEEASRRVVEFMDQNKASFETSHKRYGVSPEVTAGLLFMESRYGENQGRFHLPSVFVNLLLVDRPEVIEYLKEKGPDFKGDKLSAKQKREIAKRCRRKSEWALGELRALEKMHRKDPSMVNGLKGSFAGAFGMPQFLPSSYLVYARAAEGKRAADLREAQDAIHSVAHYLKASGWRRSRQSRLNALLKYNKSTDYAEAILELAERAKKLKTP